MHYVNFSKLKKKKVKEEFSGKGKPSGLWKIIGGQDLKIKEIGYIISVALN